MITLIIAVLILVAAIFLLRTYDYDLLGLIVIIFDSLFLFFHIVSLLLLTYDYELFVVKKESFQRTLSESRLNSRELESATILKEVVEWNKDLAERKYNNTTLFFDQYYDDRIMELEPIK